MIRMIVDNENVNIKWLEFSDGALTCKIDEISSGDYRYISLSVCPSTPCKQVLEEICLVLSAVAEIRKLVSEQI